MFLLINAVFESLCWAQRSVSLDRAILVGCQLFVSGCCLSLFSWLYVDFLPLHIFMFFSHGPEFNTGKSSVFPRAVWDLYRICSRWAMSHSFSVLHKYNWSHMRLMFLPSLTPTSASSQHGRILSPSCGHCCNSSNICNLSCEFSENSHRFMTFLWKKQRLPGCYCNRTVSVVVELELGPDKATGC